MQNQKKKWFEIVNWAKRDYEVRNAHKKRDQIVLYICWFLI